MGLLARTPILLLSSASLSHDKEAQRSRVTVSGHTAVPELGGQSHRLGAASSPVHSHPACSAPRRLWDTEVLPRERKSRGWSPAVGRAGPVWSAGGRPCVLILELAVWPPCPTPSSVRSLPSLLPHHPGSPSSLTSSKRWPRQ